MLYLSEIVALMSALLIRKSIKTMNPKHERPFLPLYLLKPTNKDVTSCTSAESQCAQS